MLVNTSQGGGGGTVPSGTLEAMQAQIDALQAQLNNYQLLSQKDQANGYAALNAQRQLDPARIPSAPRWTTARTLSLAGDATGSVAWDGSANATLTVDVPGLDSLQGGGAGAIAAALIQDRKPAYANGGTFSTGAWRTRDLNFLSSSIPGISLSNNQFSLPVGSYIIFSTAPVFAVGRHQSRLLDVSSNIVAKDVNDNDIYSGKALSGTTHSDAVFLAQVNTTTTKIFRIEHICQNTYGGYGFGVGDSFDTAPSIFTQVFVWKI